MATLVGLDCDLLINEAGYASPVWELCGAPVNVSFDLELNEVDASRRSSNGWRENVVTLRDATINATLIVDADDAVYKKIQAHAENKTSFEVAVVDGASAEAGNDYFNAVVVVTQWNKSQDLEDVVQVEAVFRPTPDVDITPSFGQTPLPTTRP